MATLVIIFHQNNMIFSYTQESYALGIKAALDANNYTDDGGNIIKFKFPKNTLRKIRHIKNVDKELVFRDEDMVDTIRVILKHESSLQSPQKEPME